jgi:HD-like signal output (HDOD) protein
MNTPLCHKSAAIFVNRGSLAFMNMSRDATMRNDEEIVADLQAPALDDSGFRMLEDIARELAGEVIFPTCFDAAFRLRRQLQDPQLPAARIASIVSAEPLVATKLIHLANSVFYQRRSNPPANDLKAAIARLGIDLVRTTALAVAMAQLLRSKDLVAFSECTRELWAHSLNAAAAARCVAHAQTRINPDEALLAGLVHDLGAFYMLYRAVQYAPLRAQPETLKQLIGNWHESIGVTLLNALGMPEEIVQATIDHDQSRTLPVPVQTLADIVYVGNLIAASQVRWLRPDSDDGESEADDARRSFAALLPEIDADTAAMQAAFN